MKSVLQYLIIPIILPILLVIMMLECLLNLFLWFIYDTKAELNIVKKGEKHEEQEKNSDF